MTSGTFYPKTVEKGSDPVPIPANNPGPMTGEGNNTWLIDGAEPMLVDAGVGNPAHLDAIARALGGRPLARVVVTHGHADHMSGVPELRARWPEIEASKWVQPGESGWRALEDGARIGTGDNALRVIYTPGHAPDHICLWNEITRDLYAGDMVQAETTVVIPAGRGGSLRDYMTSLERLAALRPARILPGHGPVITQPLDLINQYLAHRRFRERQILACLNDGIADPDAIVLRVYPDLAPALRLAARATVEAHLEKIREDPTRPVS
jgi:glyoxylase-like metal-dependent hydrolase (beta-lactamase superfamily II)